MKNPFRFLRKRRERFTVPAGPAVQPGSVRDLFLKLRGQRMAYGAFWILLLLYLSAVFAGFLSPYHYATSFRDYPTHPPMKIHFLGEEGDLHPRPFVYASRLEIDPESHAFTFTEDRTRPIPLQFFVRGDEYHFLGLIPSNLHLFGLADSEQPLFLLGSDRSGRDLVSRIFYGGQISLSVGLAGVLISMVIGLLVGGAAGYFGGWIDTILMRICEAIMMVPGLYLLMILAALFQQTFKDSAARYLMIIVVLSFIGWAGLARVIRGIVLSIREREYVTAARAVGASHLRIITRYIIPNTMSYTLVAATLSIPGYILGESALSLIGLGIQEPQTSWGNMLAAAKSTSVIALYPWMLIPGFAIFVAVMAFNFLGDGLRDIYDPTLQEAGERGE